MGNNSNGNIIFAPDIAVFLGCRVGGIELNMVFYSNLFGDRDIFKRLASYTKAHIFSKFHVSVGLGVFNNGPNGKNSRKIC